jgi:hypothetical protein
LRSGPSFGFESVSVLLVLSVFPDRAHICTVQRVVLVGAIAGLGGSLGEIVCLLIPLDTRVGWYPVKLDWNVFAGCFG